MTSGIEAEIEDIAADFALLDDWEARYSYVIELGRALPPLPLAERTEATKVRGCASQVWIVAEPAPGGRLAFRGDSDAHIVRGLIALLLRVFSDRTPDEILAVDPKAFFTRLGLGDALTQQRSNGLFSMIERIRRTAQAAIAA
jgi:cysteine desulfuration protein SufE